MRNAMQHDGSVDVEDIARQLVEVWEGFAEDECKGYSPLYDSICRAVARDEDVLALAAAAPLFGRQPNVLLAAVHPLLLGGADGELADLYHRAERGDRDVDVAGAGPLFCEFALERRDEVAVLLATRRTNTNECGRSAVVLPALRWAAGVVGEPLALLDVGASAGLNLNLDRYRIDYRPVPGAVGPASSPVVITTDLEGEAPVAGGAPPIAARCGLDRAPVDLGDPEDARWQLACVWPDTGRLARTRAAIALAQEHPNEVVEGDAVDDLAAVVASRLPPAPMPLCITTTWVVAYLRRADRLRFAEAVAALAHDRDVVWISAEAPGIVAQLEAPPEDRRDGTKPSVGGATVHRAGGSTSTATVLGTCHPHGTWLRWTAPPGA
jgi:hypothetical protein